MKPVVAILGRPNVGKSTLFNRLIGRRSALVDPTPGVTRDRREGDAYLGRLNFTVVDTAGLENAPANKTESEMQAQSLRALEQADVVLLLIDARSGLTPLDRHFADLLRRSSTPVVLVANKCEARAADAGILEAWELGLGEPIPIAAEHGIGMPDLETAIADALLKVGLSAEKPEPQETPEEEDAAGEGDEEVGPAGPLQLAIVGRPNVGKSTLMNRLLGEERVITGPEPGMTRDAISVEWSWNGQPVRLVDTAGMRRKSRVDEKIEKLSVADTLEAVRFAHVVVLVLDANEMPEKQDLTIASYVIDEGRAVVIAVNKWDAVEDGQEALQRLRDRLEISLPQLRGVPIVTISALTGRGVDRLLPTVFKAYEIWNRRIPTGPLNRWLQATVERHPPPIFRGRRIRVRYITQSKARPPTFAVFVSQPLGVPEAYVRYLTNGIRETFDFPGVPIRINLRRQRNPYTEGASEG
jgi:GTP-binding protein